MRVWPAEDYTRVTLENDGELKATHFMVADPPRLVVDIEGLALNETLKSLVAKIESNDPYIKQVRVAQNRPNVVRLVFDLKEEVKPQVFTLAPVAGYRHRLIFDLYPVKAVDPLASMIAKENWSRDDERRRPPRRRRPPAGRADRRPGQSGCRSPSWKPTPRAPAAPARRSRTPTAPQPQPAPTPGKAPPTPARWRA